MTIYEGLNFRSKRGKYPVAGFPVWSNGEQFCILFKYHDKLDSNTVPDASRRYRYRCIACNRTDAGSKKAQIVVSFPDDKTGRFHSDPADKDRHSCDWESDEAALLHNVLAEKLALESAQDNAAKSVNGHVKLPSAVTKDVNIDIIRGTDQRVSSVDVQEVANSYCGGDVSRLRKRQISRHLRKATDGKPLESFSDLPDDVLEVVGTNDSYRVSDANDNNRLYLASQRTFDLCYALGIEALLADGNFSYTPTSITGRLCYQLYTIRACVRNTSFLLIASFLPSKSGREYERLLTILRDMLVTAGAHLNRLRIVTDYEKGMIFAIGRILPQMRHEGCLFHLQKAFNLRVADLGFTHLCKGDAHMRRWIDRLRASFYAPRHMIMASGLLVVPVPPAHQAHSACLALLAYFSSEWLSKPETMTNKFMMEVHRTTNLQEAWHRGLASHFSGAHPPLKEVVAYLQKEECKDYTTLHTYQTRGGSHAIPAKDADLRKETMAPMEAFNTLMQSGALVTTLNLFDFLDEMSQFTFRGTN